jgi:hypothetical protein
MSRRDEYLKDKLYKEIDDALARLAQYIRYTTKISDFNKGMDFQVGYRILPYPEEELKLWEEYGGYDPSKSHWKRFVFTANRYLGCMIKMGLGPPMLKEPEVMFEFLLPSELDTCVKYSEAALGKFPLVGGKLIGDVYVDQKDIPLFECWREHKVRIDDVKKIYISKTARPHVKQRALDFAKKYNIPVEYGVPCPSSDEKTMPEYDRPSKYGVTDSSLRKIISFLSDRSMACFAHKSPLPDSVVAALTETYDMNFHNEKPLGTSDAIFVKNEREREKPGMFEYPAPIICDLVRHYESMKEAKKS